MSPPVVVVKSRNILGLRAALQWLPIAIAVRESTKQKEMGAAMADQHRRPGAIYPHRGDGDTGLRRS
jgi:hypothetical protein